MTKIAHGIAVVVTVAIAAAFFVTNVWAADVQPILPVKRHGIFVPVPYALAATVIRRAEQGNMNAQAQLGWMYETGGGVPQDYVKAAKWYYIAAIQGQGDAQFELAMMYNKGEGVPCDYVLAYMWMNLSASQAASDDRDFKSRMRDALASKLTVAQVALAQHMALTWYKLR